jgi:hypothetical protein
MQSFEKGTSYVKKTGPAILHKGEAVIAKEKNPMKMKDKAKAVSMEALGDKSKPKKEIKEMHIRKSHDGRHIVKHVHKHPSHPDEEHIMEHGDQLHDHIAQHMTEPNLGEMEAEAGQHGLSDGQAAAAGIPAAPAAPAGGPMPMQGGQ